MTPNISSFSYIITRCSGPYGPFLLAPAEGCGAFSHYFGAPSSKLIPPLNLSSNFVQKNGVTLCFSLNRFKVSIWPPIWGAMEPWEPHWGPQLQIDVTIELAIKFRGVSYSDNLKTSVNKILYPNWRLNKL